jgi:hypothetical protein
LTKKKKKNKKTKKTKTNKQTNNTNEQSNGVGVCDGSADGRGQAVTAAKRVAPEAIAALVALLASLLDDVGASPAVVWRIFYATTVVVCD